MINVVQRDKAHHQPHNGQHQQRTDVVAKEGKIQGDLLPKVLCDITLGTGGVIGELAVVMGAVGTVGSKGRGKGGREEGMEGKKREKMGEGRKGGMGCVPTPSPRSSSKDASLKTRMFRERVSRRFPVSWSGYLRERAGFGKRRGRRRRRRAKDGGD